MRNIGDKAAYIKEIQRFLSSVLKINIRESGVWDENTKTAVRRFKSENGMTADTVVDYETFSLLYSRYSEGKDAPARTLVKGDRGDEVLRLNMMLRRVAGGYSEAATAAESSYFSELTETSIISLKKIFMMDGDGAADAIFLKRLQKEYELTRDGV